MFTQPGIGTFCQASVKTLRQKLHTDLEKYHINLVLIIWTNPS